MDVTTTFYTQDIWTWWFAVYLYTGGLGAAQSMQAQGIVHGGGKYALRKVGDVEAIRQIRDAVDNGVNYVDTAWPYHGGESEPFLGRALSGGYREKVRIATKLPSWLVESREEDYPFQFLQHVVFV